MTITNWNEIAGLIVAIFTILAMLLGSLAWLFRLEFQTRLSKDTLNELKNELGVLETRVETKVDGIQTSMNTVLVTMGELKGRMSSEGYGGHGA